MSAASSSEWSFATQVQERSLPAFGFSSTAGFTAQPQTNQTKYDHVKTHIQAIRPELTVLVHPQLESHVLAKHQTCFPRLIVLQQLHVALAAKLPLVSLSIEAIQDAQAKTSTATTNATSVQHTLLLYKKKHAGLNSR